MADFKALSGELAEYFSLAILALLYQAQQISEMPSIGFKKDTGQTVEFEIAHLPSLFQNTPPNHDPLKSHRPHSSQLSPFSSSSLVLFKVNYYLKI